MPQISIICPFYNSEGLLERFIKRILEQTMTDFELIMVDDGSDDKGSEVVSQYISRDDRIQLFVQERAGAGKAYNLGLTKAQGNYICFLDLINVPDMDYLEKMFCSAKETGADIVACAGRIHFDKKDITRFMESTMRSELISGVYVFDRSEKRKNLFQVSGVYLWNKLFRSDYLNELCTSFAETIQFYYLPLIIRALMKAKKVALLDRELITHYVEVENELEKVSILSENDFVNITKRIYEKEFSEVSDKEACESFVIFLVMACVGLMSGGVKYNEYKQIYDYSKNEIMAKAKNISRDYFKYEIDYLRWNLLKVSKSEIDYLLRSRDLKVSTPTDVTYRIYRFPFDYIKKESSVLIVGADDIGRDLYLQVEQTGYCKQVMWIDEIPEKYRYRGLPVVAFEDVELTEFDTILVCAEEYEDIAAKVNKLLYMGAYASKIIKSTPKFDKDKAVRGQ